LALGEDGANGAEPQVVGPDRHPVLADDPRSWPPRGLEQLPSRAGPEGEGGEGERGGQGRSGTDEKADEERSASDRRVVEPLAGVALRLLRPERMAFLDLDRGLEEPDGPDHDGRPETAEGYCQQDAL